MYSGIKYDVTIQLSHIHCTYYTEHNETSQYHPSVINDLTMSFNLQKTLAQTNSTSISHRGLKGKGLGERVIDRLVRCQERHCICHCN